MTPEAKDALIAIAITFVIAVLMIALFVGIQYLRGDLRWS